MAKRKIHEVNNNNDKMAKVYFDPDWEEYIVTFWLDGDKIKDADYHSWEKYDAINTANNWVNAR